MVKFKMSTNILKWTSPVGKLSARAHSSHLFPTNVSANQNQSPKRWIHDDALLVGGHVAYLVKFLGNVEVDQPKGLGVVREAIKKLEFQEHLKRSEGEKIRRIELTISIDGVAIREPKSKQNIHQFPLHRISYCADDKSERKYLSFITKVQGDTERHECFVFVSDKLSEEITLTIGQAFELAYRKYLDASGKDFDTKKELVMARKRIQELERKVLDLEQKIKDSNKETKPLTNATVPNKKLSTSSQNPEFQTPPVSPTSAPQTIDLSLATSRLQSLI